MFDEAGNGAPNFPDEAVCAEGQKRQIVKVVSKGSALDTRITLDGHPMLKVTAADWHIDTQLVGMLHLEIVAPEVDLSVPADRCMVDIPLPVAGGRIQIPLSSLLRWMESGVPE